MTDTRADLMRWAQDNGHTVVYPNGGLNTAGFVGLEVWQRKQDEIDALRAENERLRVELKDAAMVLSLSSDIHPSHHIQKILGKWMEEWTPEDP